MRARSRLLVLLYSWFLIAVVVTAFFKSRAIATTDYARQTGQPCAACHTRPEGGGELNAHGLAYVRGGYQWPIPAGVEAYTPSNVAKALKLIFGYTHLTTAVIWFGAIFYIHIIVKPQKLTTGVPKAEGILGWVSITIMALTGIALTVFRYLETGSVFSGTFGIVFVIKLVQVGIMVIVALIATVVLSPRMRQSIHPSAAPNSASGEITPETLSSLDGKDGGRAVIAVSGKLYDVTGSPRWQNGVHFRRHQSGQDLTEALKEAPHDAEVLEKVPVIGELKTDPVKAGLRRSRAQRVFVAFAYVNLALMFGVLLCVAWWKRGFTWTASSPARDVPMTATLSEVSSDCITCHNANKFMTAQIVEWERSVHATWQVGCYECHRAEEGDADAMEHNGYVVSVLVTPRDCARCHVREVEEFAASRHSRGGDILDSLDNVLGEQVEGLAATVLGCQQCHGAPVEVMPGGTLSPASWPNTGIGRINPDGSRGACSTCHTRHLFSVAVAREPDSCGNCHLGPDHPQKEIYEESKHGIAFSANREKMNLEAKPWVLGQDYSAAPTCATCHMSAVPGLSVNHDVGLRIAWTLRPAVSARQENWEERRENMEQVCQQCHSPGFFENFFGQFDDAVELYDAKFAMPAQEIMQHLREADKLTDVDFDEQIEWTYFLLWHHEGRRARHGAAMMGPDYVQWHGFFEVGSRFYNEFVPQAEALLPGVTEPFLEEEYHKWRTSE
jgi:predicted heme/steroid binding protein